MAFAVLVGPASTHPAGAKHGHGYGKNYYPAGYFNYCEPDGANYLGVSRVEYCERCYTSYRKAWVNGRQYYKLNADFRWTDSGKSEEYSVTKPLYAALHKYNDYGSKRPAFRVLLTNRETGKHYWRRFEARGSVPPNTVIVGGPHFKEVDGQRFATWELFSPDSMATFQARAYPDPWQTRPPFQKVGKTVTVRVYDGTNVFDARALDRAGHVDSTRSALGIAGTSPYGPGFTAPAH